LLLPLREHDPSIVLAMLGFAYNSEMNLPNIGVSSTDNALFIVELYRVAIKYSFPSLLTKSLFLLKEEVGALLSQEYTKGAFATEDFCQIIKKFYTLPGADSKHDLIAWILGRTKCEGPLQIFRKGSEVPELLIDASQQVAEFGRDLFFYTMVQPGGFTRAKFSKRNVVHSEDVMLARCPFCHTD
jgi:hypothetical protein